MIRTSEGIEMLSEALAKAQSKFGAAIKGSTNPAFRSKYADLTSIIDATLEHLNAEGIAVMQHPSLDGQMVTVTTRLQHKSGQWMESDIGIPGVQRERFDAQSVGSAITYGCRYALQSICLVPREDDDGQGAVGSGSQEAAQAVGSAKVVKAAKDGNKTAQQAVNSGKVPAMFFQWHDESQTATIVGDQSLKTAHKDILGKLWNQTVGQIVADAEQLEALKYEFEKRNVIFKPLKDI
jgi:ERF superfamily